MEMIAIFGKRRKKKLLDSLRLKIEKFQSLLDHNNRVLELMADAGEKQSGDFIFDIQYLHWLAAQLEESVGELVLDLNSITDNRYPDLTAAFEKTRRKITNDLESRITVPETPYVFQMDEIGMELSDAVGEKMARLGEVRNRLKLNVPEGFVITAYACRRFFDKITLSPKIIEVSGDRNLPAEEVENRLAGAVKAAALPRGTRKAILGMTAGLKRKNGGERLFAVRSSAIGEDGYLSFAGLHDSFLGVTVREAPKAYQDVIASLFNARAVEYRRTKKEPLEAALMAVGFLRMVPARASGVLYTLDPNFPETDTMIITAAYGLGKMVVEGKGNIDQFKVERNPPHNVVSRNIGEKREMYEPAPAAGVRLSEVPSSLAAAPAVPDEFISTLAAAALRIEKYMKTAMDIEWARDENGELVILQARPLRIHASPSDIREKVRESVHRHKSLISNMGTIACRGIGHGRVVVVGDDVKPESLPENTVLVARTSSPHLAELVPSASAVVTDQGAPTGHLATITREYRVPSIMDVEVATQVLKDGMEITVDAEENVIYEGKVEELLKYQVYRSSSFEDTREFRILRRILKNVAPLNLKNPQSKNFSPRRCETYHDIIRFAHEKSVEHLIAGFANRSLHNYAGCKRVKMDLPLDLTVIDMGGGLAAPENQDECLIGDVICAPLRALLEGLTAPGAWSTDPAGMDFGSFMASATGKTPVMSQAGAPDGNLAIISDRYLNLNLHLGYHFNQVVSYISDSRNDNYIYFRFLGGMTDISRRSRRVKMISMILEKQDFMVETKGDFATAGMKKFDLSLMLDRMKMLGYLIGFTRQMDVRMRSDSTIDRFIDQFLSGLYNMENGSNEPDSKEPLREKE
ncbi:MAG: PEP/pyruvate-binding domain-containing protein [bacterium]